MSFVTEKAVKATRKRHVCSACNKWIEAGERAVSWAGTTDGDFSSAHFHPECRAAEIALNDLHDTRYSDEWIGLGDADAEDYPWLKANHPLPYRRWLMSREQWAAVALTRASSGDTLSSDMEKGE